MSKTFSTIPSLQEQNRIIQCPCCGSESFKPYWDCGTFMFVKCKKCRLILQNPQPLPEDLSFRYDQSYCEYEVKNQTVFSGLQSQGLKDINFNSFFSEKNGKKILDVGCATGRLLKDFKDAGWSCTGVEICDPSAEYGRVNYDLDIKSCTLEQAEFQKALFDVVHHSHVIEHIPDMDNFLKENNRVLKTGGFLVCTTPNAFSLQRYLFKQEWRSAIADHIFLFSRFNLARMMKFYGFRILTLKSWGGLGIGTSPLWLKKIADPLVKKLNIGDVMIILAIKEKNLSDKRI